MHKLYIREIKFCLPYTLYKFTHYMKTSPFDEQLYRNYTDQLLAGNKDYCLKIVNKLVQENYSLRDIYEHLFQKSLYEIGALWESNAISVAKEHLTSSITAMIMNSLYPTIFKNEKIGKKAVISCVVNEFHQIGGQMVADIFELYGWHTYFLEANTPSSVLYKLIDETNPDIVGLSVTLSDNISELINISKYISNTYPDLSVIIGGQAFAHIGKESFDAFSNTAYYKNLKTLEAFLKETQERNNH